MATNSFIRSFGVRQACKKKNIRLHRTTLYRVLEAANESTCEVHSFIHSFIHWRTAANPPTPTPHTMARWNGRAIGEGSSDQSSSKASIAACIIGLIMSLRISGDHARRRMKRFDPCPLGVGNGRCYYSPESENQPRADEGSHAINHAYHRGHIIDTTRTSKSTSIEVDFDQSRCRSRSTLIEIDLDRPRLRSKSTSIDIDFDLDRHRYRSK